jgi:hypothetical protein
VSQPDARLRFLRVLGTIWLIIIALTLGGAAVAPYLGRIERDESGAQGVTA